MPMGGDGNYTGDPDDDNDGLPDVIEELLGSDPKNSSDVTSIVIDGETNYLVDTNADGTPDTYYNLVTGTSTVLTIQADGTYLIDVDGDGTWDYVYDPVLGEVTAYAAEVAEDWTWVILVVVVIIVVIILVIIFLFKIGYLYVEEVPPEEPHKPKEKTKEKKPEEAKKKP